MRGPLLDTLEERGGRKVSDNKVWSDPQRTLLTLKENLNFLWLVVTMLLFVTMLLTSLAEEEMQEEEVFT